MSDEYFDTDYVRHLAGWSTRLDDWDEGEALKFDLWLIAERKRVAEMATEKERERIITLLEKHGVELVEDNWEDNQAVNDAYIALIKGGTSE